jgi:hypothetical protein
MKCSNCNTDYFDPNQIICEHCGAELIKVQPVPVITTGKKLDIFLEDTGLKNLFKKIKENLKNI